MTNPRAIGFKSWIASMTEAELKAHNSKAGQKGGEKRAKALSKARRHAIAVMGGKANRERLASLRKTGS